MVLAASTKKNGEPPYKGRGLSRAADSAQASKMPASLAAPHVHLV